MDTQQHSTIAEDRHKTGTTAIAAAMLGIFLRNTFRRLQREAKFSSA